MMQMTQARLALPMHSLTHHHGRSQRTHAGSVGEAAATKAGGPPLICHKNFRGFATDGSLFVANGLGSCGSFSLLRNPRRVRFPAATSPATVYLPPLGRSLAIAPHSL